MCACGLRLGSTLDAGEASGRGRSGALPLVRESSKSTVFNARNPLQTTLFKAVVHHVVHALCTAL